MGISNKDLALLNQIRAQTGKNMSAADYARYFGDLAEGREAEFMKQEFEAGQTQAQRKTGTSLRGIMSQGAKMQAKSGFATSGEVTSATDVARQSALESLEMGMQSGILGMEKSQWALREKEEGDLLQRIATAEDAGYLE